MKSLVLTAQDARDLQSLGSLIVTKPIKNAPEYVEGGRIVCSATAPGSFRYEREGATDTEAPVFTPPVQAGDAAYIRERTRSFSPPTSRTAIRATSGPPRSLCRRPPPSATSEL